MMPDKPLFDEGEVVVGREALGGEAPHVQRLRCPQCNRRLVVEATDGMAVRCPKCGLTFPFEDAPKLSTTGRRERAAQKRLAREKRHGALGDRSTDGDAADFAAYAVTEGCMSCGTFFVVLVCSGVAWWV